MEKNLSSMEERVLRYSTFTEKCLDGIGLALLSFVILRPITKLKDYSILSIQKFIADNASSNFGKIGAWILATAIVTRTLIFYVKQYLGWRATTDYSMEEAE